MSGQALYRRWRPRRFGDVVGQEHVTRTLSNAVRLGRVGHGYLFCGPRGIAKTSTARILAKAINCLSPQEGEPCDECELCLSIGAGTSLDVIEMDAASNGLVENVRDLRQNVLAHPDQARRKVYILDEAHRMSAPAFDALLKTLEEPPEHVVFILVTSEADKIPPTIVSRCQRFDFRRLPQRGIVSRLDEICRSEGVDAEPAALDLIARAATGSMRDAQSILDQLLALGEKKLSVGDVEVVLGTAGTQAARDLAAHVIRREQGPGLGLISRAVGEGADPRQFCRDVTDYLRGLLMIKLGGPDETLDVSNETRAEMSKLADEASTETLLRAVRLFGLADATWRGTLHFQLPLELAFVESTLDASAPAPNAQPAAGPRTLERPAPRPEMPARPPLAAPRSNAPRLADSRPAEAGPPPAPPVEKPPEPTPPPVEAATNPPSEPVSAASVGDVGEVARRWPEIRRGIRNASRTVEALLNDVRPRALDGAKLMLEARFALHKSRVMERNNRQLIEDEVARTVGQRLEIDCVVAESWERAPDEPPDPTDDPAVRKAVERGWRARYVPSEPVQ